MLPGGCLHPELYHLQPSCLHHWVIPAADAAGGFSAYAACRRPDFTRFRVFSLILEVRAVFLEVVSLIFVYFGVFGRFLTFSDVFGRFRTFSDVFGRFWTFSDVFSLIFVDFH